MTKSPQNTVHWSVKVYTKKKKRKREKMQTLEGAASTLTKQWSLFQRIAEALLRGHMVKKGGEPGLD